jgi:hypothetical protein
MKSTSLIANFVSRKQTKTKSLRFVIHRCTILDHLVILCLNLNLSLNSLLIHSLSLLSRYYLDRFCRFDRFCLNRQWNVVENISSIAFFFVWREFFFDRFCCDFRHEFFFDLFNYDFYCFYYCFNCDFRNDQNRRWFEDERHRCFVKKIRSCTNKVISKKFSRLWSKSRSKKFKFMLMCFRSILLLLRVLLASFHLLSIFETRAFR